MASQIEGVLLQSAEAQGASPVDRPQPEADREGGTIPGELPILPLKNTVVFPLTVLPLVVQKPRSVRLVDDVVVADRQVGLVALRNPEVEDPTPNDLYTMGTVATIHRLARAPDGTLHIIVQGTERIRILEFTQTEPYMKARVEPAPDIVEEGVEVEALVRSTADLFRRLVGLAAYLPEEVVANVLSVEDPRQLAYMIATSTRMDMAVRQEILELDRVSEKLRRLLTVLTREVEVLELGKKIQSDAQSGIEKVQREYFLREQLKAIQRELGEEDEQAVELRELREKIEAAGMPEEAKKEALRELDRMSKLPVAAAEYGVIRTYLGWLIDLPWQKVTEDRLDIAEARRVLDEDHYDLERIKERILEFLAVRKLRQERRAAGAGEEGLQDHIRQEREGVILCFVGPPGVGKTSLGRSIARALGRKFVRLSLGGVRDEAEIRGHRRTYVGALPGRIIQSIRRAGSNNPVFILDEVDKLGADFRGDPSSALLEVLDPEQNYSFSDHYLDVGFDLSKVMFICTANMLDTVPPPLRDRLEVLELPGYTEEEKLDIAFRYLIPRQLEAHGLTAEQVVITKEAVRTLIASYTREAGLRNLEREIASLCRGAGREIVEGAVPPVKIDADKLAGYLGPPRFFREAALEHPQPGVATGLAWTPTGGDILFIEALRMPGKGHLKLTGQLGEVMKESADAALSYIRAKAPFLGIEEDFFEDSDLHIHVPAGSIPKDGPSAGLAMLTALVSLLSGRPVKKGLAMTGEITLRGDVLPVGGIKNKVLAAHRAGLAEIILPAQNAKVDVEEIPEEVRRDLVFHPVERLDEALKIAFSEP